MSKPFDEVSPNRVEVALLVGKNVLEVVNRRG